MNRSIDPSINRSIGRRERLVTAAVALGVTALGAQQQPPPAFRAGTDTVAVYATVRDQSGRLVTDLSQGDFSVFDNGRPQPIVTFSRDPQPVSVVVMLDRSGSAKDRFTETRRAVGEFVRGMLPGDEARLGNFGSEIRIVPDEFSSDQAALLKAFDESLQDEGPSPIWTAMDKSLAALDRAKERRVVLLFTDGYNAPAFNQFRADVEDVRRRAERDEVMVYIIGFEGRTLSAPFSVFGNSPMAAPRVEPPHPDLKKLADQTGGGYYELKRGDDLARRFAEIADELHRQYLIGFPPTALDGKTHKLEVKAKASGLTVRARKSYVARSGAGR
jgi:VWFA-related protein